MEVGAAREGFQDQPTICINVWILLHSATSDQKNLLLAKTKQLTLLHLGGADDSMMQWLL